MSGLPISLDLEAMISCYRPDAFQQSLGQSLSGLAVVNVTKHPNTQPQHVWQTAETLNLA
jgi:hypothetical protein